MREAACVLDAKALLGEGPVWDVAEQRLYWVDIKGRRIHRFDPRSGQNEAWPTAEDVGSLAVREGGGLVVAMKSGFHFYDLEAGAARRVAGPPDEPAGNRFNDGKTDREGRFWAGTMDDGDRDACGSLYCLDAALECRRMVDGVICSNSLCWSPDGRTMYYSDSWRRTVWAWDVDPAGPAIANRRVFLELPAAEGVPDGATVDGEGCLWLAQWDGWRLCRYDPQGRLERVVRLPVQRPTCPMFGGADLATLYVTSARIGLDDAALAKQPLAGGIFALEPGVAGVPEARFKG
jgi:sugar lactone lactonase YvrE